MGLKCIYKNVVLKPKRKEDVVKKTGIELQQEKAKHLFNLIKENPELEIMPMVNSEIVVSDDWSYWVGSWGDAEVDEYWCNDERIYFRSQDEDELTENVMCDEIDENIDDKEAERLAEEIVKNYNWKKAIVVKIEMA